MRDIIWYTIKGEYVSSEYRADLLHITLNCPVDMIVTDPDGLTISSGQNQIPGAVYVETDLNEDGDPDDHVIIPHAKEGDYEITLIPEPGAVSTDTYTLTASRGDSTTVMVENSAVADIPDEPYILTVTLPSEDSNTTVIIIASVCAFAVIVGLVFLLRRKRGEKQTS